MLVTWGPYAHRDQQAVVHLEERRLSLVVLSPRPDVRDARRLRPDAYADLMTTWEGVEAHARTAPAQIAYRAGTPDLSMTGRYVDGLPPDDGDRAEMTFQVMGKITLDLDGPLGHDEWVDYSIFDFLCATDGTPQLIVSRFAVTGGLKAGFSARMRSLFPHAANSHITLCLPFAKRDLREVELIAVSWGRYKPLGFVPDEERAAVPPGAKLAYGLYEAAPRADADLSVPAGGTISVPIYLRWKSNIDYGHAAGTPARHRTRLKVEASAGYVPYRVVEMDEHGEGRLRLTALGLAPGDDIKVKLNATHFTGVGSFVIRVV